MLVAGAALVVALAGYLILIVAARSLGPERYSSFAVFWSAVYLGVGAVFGIQQETTRAVSQSISSPVVRPASRIVPTAIAVGALLAIIVAASSPLWASRTFGADAVIDVILVAAALVLYAGHSATVGAFAGAQRWRAYSGLLVAEGLVRICLVVLVAAVIVDTRLFEVATVVAMAVWLVFLIRRGLRSVVLVEVAGSFSALALRYLQSIGGAAASALLVTGYPFLLSLFVGRSDQADLGVAILVVTLTRAPVLLPLNAFLNMMIVSFHGRSGRSMIRALSRPIMLIGGITLIVAVGGFFLGRPLIALVFGAEYLASPLFIAGCALAAGIIALLSVSGAAVLASGRHLAYFVGWLAAAAISCLMLAVPLTLPLDSRVVISLAAGPVVGGVIHLIFLALPRAPAES